jgi:CubicO group peptidase (beta-lactamase class C family)
MIKKQLYPAMALSFLLSFSLCLSSVFAVPTAELQKDTVSSFGSVDDLEDDLLAYMESGHMPSLSVCIIKGDQVVWSKSYGYANLRKKTDATPDTIYLAGSISKVVTATALMQLYEQGRFNLDDDINNYLPFSLRNPSYPDTPITIRMLLAHQSSLAEREVSLFLYFSLFNCPEDNLAEYLTPDGKFYSPSVWYNTPPGSEGHYSSLGYEVLGYLIELLTNESYETYCNDHVFIPLNMHNTSFLLTNLPTNHLATPYLWLLGNYIPLPNYQIDSLCAAAGGLQTTANDLSHLMIVHMNNGTYNGIQILNKETVDLMHTPQYPGSNRRFGFGWQFWGWHGNETSSQQGHVGEVPGGTTFMYYRKEVNTGVVFCINQYTLKRPLEFVAWFGIGRTLFDIAQNL